ncbi:GNAT family N-acetyltransferase [Sediminicurvatus halobius]|uniref:GNAT family N-acetyltransferase n=1 Tax=Sediminicurvatus halobius TaxID=2182432 RepID=A0A2U2N6L4_9GAMM|nr:GNAT family N-acetyltransferase [Spiribacter halobius]PWG64619.1 GNAT family N-acetyltransferase [Spiribacter halobius]UEX79058.1 GNAT family N-acetyltransferase [Spiribacter halobius]
MQTAGTPSDAPIARAATELRGRQPTLRLAEAATPTQLAAVADLLEDYEQTLGIDIAFDGLAGERSALRAGDSGDGILLLATAGGEPAGCCALRPRGDGVWELKRLFVRADCTGQGIGERLVRRGLALAGARGARCVRLETSRLLVAAQRLYQRLGFREVPLERDLQIPLPLAMAFHLP